MTGDALRSTLHDLAGGPFRTRPTFLPGPWGGQWLRRGSASTTDAPNLAWSYELITPESGILLGADETVEVGFELLMALEGERVLGADGRRAFRTSFPIRFDYLDTLEGGHLSLQCHPSAAYARETFGLDYTQDETYYVMETTPGAKRVPRSPRRRRPGRVQGRGRAGRAGRRSMPSVISWRMRPRSTSSI